MFLSLCLPTNGIEEWVFPALESIYNQGVDDSSFEVIVTDNGNNSVFSKKMLDYAKKHANFFYKKTNAYMFENQLEALKIAKGDYLKFVNHRSIWKQGQLKNMIDFLERNQDIKPVIYFSNGAKKWGDNYREYNKFDDFVRNLGIYGTWTSGVGIWKEDYERIPADVKIDKISPHSTILYSERRKPKYIINDCIWMKDITSDHSQKGKYDLYKAFSLDEFIIVLNLYRDGDISFDTLVALKEEYEIFLTNLFYKFNLKGEPCSYDISNFKKYVDVFFDADEIERNARKKLHPEDKNI